jgi:hypothetical protein
MFVKVKSYMLTSEVSFSKKARKYEAWQQQVRHMGPSFRGVQMLSVLVSWCIRWSDRCVQQHMRNVLRTLSSLVACTLCHMQSCQCAL